MDRRRFLELCLKGGVSVAALTHLQLQAFQSAVEQSHQDYKALVCVFLHGGNDSLNMLVPIDGEARSLYEASRQNLAVFDYLPITPETPIDGGVALHASLSPLSALFLNKSVAFVAGVGSLMVPTTQQDYINKSVPLPKHLFSHNKQQATWMFGQENRTVNSGWGARLLERLHYADTFGSNISLSGLNPWQTSQTSMPISLSTSGISRINALDVGGNRKAQVDNALRAALQAPSHPIANAYGRRVITSVDNTTKMNLALESADPINNIFSSSTLSKRLQTIAKTISAQSQLGATRQIFYVSLGGFDTHGAQIRNHGSLLNSLSTSLAEFQTAMAYLNQQDNVTLFTMSEFGRTLSSNGDGTDHGWAGNQLVMGGAVNGGNIYGELLTQHVDGPNDTRGGRLIPKFSNEQYFATLAKWFGLPDSELIDLFPNLTHFNQRTLNFL